MKNLSRRAALEILGAAPVAAAAMMWTPADAEAAQAQAAQTRATAARFRPKFFTAHEYATVRVLVDLIIPRDERSGSATEAGVAEFMDFMMIDQPRRQVAMRGGLALVDRLAVSRLGKNVAAATDAERRRLLDEIARIPDEQREPLERDRVLQQLPRSDRDRILHEQDRHRRSAVPRQRLRLRVDRVP